jgi:hypothetical protein
LLRRFRALGMTDRGFTADPERPNRQFKRRFFIQIFDQLGERAGTEPCTCSPKVSHCDPGCSEATHIDRGAYRVITKARTASLIRF